MRSRPRVKRFIYLTHAEVLVTDFVATVKEALYHTFADLDVFSRIEECASTVSLHIFVRSMSTTLYFIVDQANVLDRIGSASRGNLIVEVTVQLD
jgi:hypothetical protein